MNFVFRLILIFNSIRCDECDEGPLPGPSGFQHIGTKFKYISEVVEHRGDLTGDIASYRFIIKFKSNGKEYALTFDPHTNVADDSKGIITAL